jgi:CheY-like chemotaxis protein
MAKTIYLIEDNEPIRVSITELLESEGYEVLSAENGQAALDFLCFAPTLPDLILLDLMMPVMDGFQFRAEQRMNEKIAKIPVILMSADVHVQQKNEKLQAADYIKKPVDIDHLLKVVEKYCP